MTVPAGQHPELDLALRIAGGVVATALGALTGLYEAMLAPAHLSPSMRAPLSLILALVLNPALAWFAVAATGWGLAGLLPALAWCVVWFAAAGRTTEGDLLIAGDNWVGLATLFLGPIAFAIGMYVTVLRRPRGSEPAPRA